MSENQNSWKAKVEIYSRDYCGFCTRAKMLLDNKQVPYVEYSIGGDYDAREKMIERAKGRYTFPQIFINDEPIGGCTELFMLEQGGELDALLLEAPANDAQD